MPSVDVKQHEISQWLALNQISGLGNAAFCQLLAKFGAPEAIYSASINQLSEVVDDDIAQKIKQGVNIYAIQPTLDWLKKDNAHLVTFADDNYPQKLLEISNPSAVLYALGNYIGLISRLLP